MKIALPKTYYRKFCLIQEAWIDLYNFTDKQLKMEMNPLDTDKLEKVEILKNGKKRLTLIWKSNPS